ncbi:MAG: zeta toxin family protein [Sphingobacteriales bacterium]
MFTAWKDNQLKGLTDCGFETNFRTRQVMDTVIQFQEKGYHVHLHFFGLDSVEASMQRVQLRVAGGGHDVSPENIKANYTQGMKNFARYNQAFDSLTVYQNLAKPEEALQITPLLKSANGVIIEQLDQLPEWLENLKPELLKNDAKRIKRKNLKP